MKKGIRAHDICADGFENVIKRFRKMGFSQMQLVLEKSLADFKFGNFSPEYAAGIRKMLGDTEIAVLGSYINPSSADDAELEAEIGKFKEKIKYASILKPLVVGTETGFYRDCNNSEKAYLRLLSTMRVLAAEAEKYNVDIAVEGVWCHVMNTPERTQRLVRDLNSDNVKVIFDPVNFVTIDNYKAADDMIEYMFDKLHDVMKVIHVKDFTVENGEIALTVPGRGMLNFRLIFEKLKQYGMDIPLISEQIPDTDAVAGFAGIEKFDVF